jgi:hypothetical protein
LDLATSFEILTGVEGMIVIAFISGSQKVVPVSMKADDRLCIGDLFLSMSKSLFSPSIGLYFFFDDQQLILPIGVVSID